MPKRKPSGDPTPKRRRREMENEREDDDDGGDEEMVPTALTRKIISQARAQQEEEEREEQQQGLVDVEAVGDSVVSTKHGKHLGDVSYKAEHANVLRQQDGRKNPKTL